MTGDPACVPLSSKYASIIMTMSGSRISIIQTVLNVNV
jgi:hypothetical protein